MSRHGSYSRKDVRIASGERLEPIPIQRWHCREHGVFSFLPAFLARWTRYLAEVAGLVVRAVAAQGKPELPLEVTGQSQPSQREVAVTPPEAAQLAGAFGAHAQDGGGVVDGAIP